MILTAGQLSLLRSEHPHKLRFYLSVFAPAIDYAGGDFGDILYAGTVNGAHDRGARTITCIDVVNNLNIAEPTSGYTVLVGPTAAGGGGPGIGGVSKRRLRDTDTVGIANDAILDANGVEWENGQYITIVRNWELWPVFPRILRAAPFTFYKDYDVVYTDENEEPPPVAIMGSHWAGFLGSGGTVTVTLDGSDSYGVAPGATISAYLWQSTGGAIANANIATTSITFNAADTYWVYLTVTDSNGKTQKTRRVFMVHDANNMPFTGFDATISLSYTGGNTLTITAFEDVDVDDWPDQSIVILWAEEWYDTTEESIGYLTDYSHIKFVGYLDAETIAADPENTGMVEFDAHCISQIMMNTPMVSVALDDTTASPTNWYTYFNLTTARAIHHLWRYHSTLFTVADVLLPISNTLRRFAMDWPQGSLISQARLTAWEQGIYCEIGCDKLGRVHVEVDPQFILEANRGAVDVVMSMGDTDWYDEYSVVREEKLLTAQVSLSGMNHDGATSIPYFANMPGYLIAGSDYDFVPEARGVPQDERNRLLAGQADANQKCGLAYAKSNNDIPELRMGMAGNYTFVDVYPQEYYRMTIAAGDTKRGVTMTNRRCIPREVDITMVAESGVVDVSVVFEPETLDVPLGVPWQYPSSIPTYVDPDTPTWPEIDQIGGTAMMFTDDDGLWTTFDAGAAWAQRNTGAGVDDWWGYFDPWGVVNNGYDPETSVLWKLGVGYIYRSIDGGKHWANVTPTTNPPNTWGDAPAPTPTDLTYTMMTPSWHAEKAHYGIANYTDGGEYRGYIVYTTNNGASWTWVALGGNTQAAATWGYVQDVYTEFWYNDGQGNPVRTLASPSRIEGAPDGSCGGAQVNFTARPVAHSDEIRYLLLDFGTYIQLDPATVDGGINAESKICTCTDTMTRSDDTTMHIFISAITDIGEFALGIIRGTDLIDWDGAVHGYPIPANTTENNAADTGINWFRYALVELTQDLGETYSGTGAFLHTFDYVRVYPSAVASEVRPISIDIDKEDGRYVYVTFWTGDAAIGRFIIHVYDLDGDGFAFPVREDSYVEGLGGPRAFITQAGGVNSRWWAVKTASDATISDYGRNFFLYGRVDNGAPNEYVIAFIDMVGAGYAWNYGIQVYEAGGGPPTIPNTGVLGAIKWISANQLLTVMNENILVADLFESLDAGVTWTKRNDPPVEVNMGGMAIHFTELALMVGEIDGPEVHIVAHPWTGAWADVTPGGAAGVRVGSLWWIFNTIW